MKFSELPEGRNHFGFRDGLHNPHVEGSGIPLQPGSGETIKAGEFILGYPDELGHIATSPEPELLRMFQILYHLSYLLQLQLLLLVVACV
jgi:hypothetical protein